jgi:excisionase family DNA binding protein
METAKIVEVEQAIFRPEEAAEYLRVGRTTMYSLLKRGIIPSVTEGSIRLVRRVDIDAYIARKLAEEK